MSIIFPYNIFMKWKSFPFFFLVFYLVWIIRATWFYSIVDVSITNETLRLVFSNFVKFILWVIPAAAFVFWFDGENPFEKMKVNTPINQNNITLIMVASVLYFVGVYFFENLMSNRTLLPLMQAPLSKILETMAAVSISPVVEELLFRGFVLNKLEMRLSFQWANIVQAFLFTAMHLPNWLWLKGFQLEMVITSAGIFILALFLGWVLKKGNSIWPPVVVHIINNFLAAFVG